MIACYRVTGAAQRPHPFMQTSNRLALPASLLTAMTCLGLAALTIASPKSAVRNHAKAPSSAPVSLGNGIFILGDDTPPVASKAAPARAARNPSQLTAPRTAPTNLNAALVRFCRSYLGQKLGNGQCSELAMLGLPAIGAQMDLNNQWGTPVCTYAAAGGRRYIQIAPVGKTRGNSRKPNIKPGDLIQYENVKFERRWDGGYSFHEYPHHTSVIEQVSRDGNTLKVLQQNVNNTQFIVETLVYLPDQTEGTMRITRPIAR